MQGVHVGERGVEGGEQVGVIFIPLRDGVTNTNYKDSYSAALLSDDLLYLLVDCLEVVDDLCLGAVNDELHVVDSKALLVHHLLLCYLAEISS